MRGVIVLGAVVASLTAAVPRLQAHSQVWPSSPELGAKSSSILFVRIRGADAEIWRVSLGSDRERRLTDNRTEDREPTWSPARDEIAFSSNRRGSYDIYIMRRDGSGVRRLTHSVGDDLDPSWAPDGQEIAFERSGGIRIVEIESGDVTRLPTAGDSFDPAWSPGGDEIAFFSVNAGQADLFLISLATHEITRLTDSPTWERDPGWCGNEAIVYRLTSRRGLNDIAILDLDTSESTRLTDNRHFEAGPACSSTTDEVVYFRYGFDQTDLATIDTVSGGRPDSLTRTAHADEFDPAW